MSKKQSILLKNYYQTEDVGDGSFLIGFKNPDFINCNGEKICIEIRAKELCKVWNKVPWNIWEQQRIEHFAKYGWKCLVIFSENGKLENLKTFFEINNLLEKNPR